MNHLNEIEAAEAAEREAERDPFLVLQEAAENLREARANTERLLRQIDRGRDRLVEAEKEFVEARDRVSRAIEELTP